MVDATMPQHDYYEILQVHPKASLAVIKKAYRTLLLELGNHPDRGGDSDTAALITEAYHVLADPVRRAAYDLTYLGMGKSGGNPSSSTPSAKAAPASKPRAAAEGAHAPRRDAEAASIVACPSCRTRNRVRSQALLSIAKCSRCQTPLVRASAPNISLRDRVVAFWDDLRRLPPKPASGPPPSKLFSLGVPLLLIGCSLAAAGYALSDGWLGFGDPVATAQHLAKEGKFEQAAQRLQRAVNHDPANPRLYELLGDVYSKQGEPVHALENYKLASTYNAQSSYYWDLQGGLYQQLNRPAEAEMCYKHSLEIDPQYAPALVALGNLVAKQQRFDDAIRLYQQALHTSPSSDVYYNLGLVYQWSGKGAEAVKAFKQALVLDPSNRSSLVSLASLYYEQHQYDLAASQLLKANALKHTDLDLHLRLAEIYERTGHNNDAIREWNLCLEQGKSNPVVTEKAHKALGRLRV